MGLKEWARAKNILCVRLDAIGDVLMTTPALKSLKEACPGRRLTLLTSKSGAKIAESMALFDNVMTYEPPWLKASASSLNEGDVLDMANALRKENYDGAVIFSVYSQNPLPSAMLCFLAGIPLRAAYCRENPYGLLTDWVKETEPGLILRHEVRRHLDLVMELGAKADNRNLVLEVRSESLSRVLKILAEEKVPERWAVIHAGATAASRRYSPRSFSAVADGLLDESIGVVFTGSLSERSIVSEIQAQMKGRGVDLSGKLSLEELIALISVAPVVISNNSSPVHICSALGTPVVDLYALTNPQHTPWMVRGSVLYEDVSCRYCYKSRCPEGTNACLEGVAPSRVIQEALKLERRDVNQPCYDITAVWPLPLAASGSAWSFHSKGHDQTEASNVHTWN